MFIKLRKKYYLDYAASCPVALPVQRAMKPLWSQRFANPASIHSSGQEVAKIIAQCDKEIRFISKLPKQGQVVWTSGGTESNHLVIDQTIRQWKIQFPNKPYTVIITSLEHDSIFTYVQNLLDPLLTVEIIQPENTGSINTTTIQQVLSKSINPILLSCIFQSNEIGVTQSIQQIGKTITQFRGEQQFPYFHTDASQGMMYNALDVPYWRADMITLCGQKIGAPKGIGALLSQAGFTLQRDGTIATPLVVGMNRALSIAQHNHKEHLQKIFQLRGMFLDHMESSGILFQLHGNKSDPSCIINLSFTNDPRDSEQLIIAFDAVGLEVSSKSACTGSQAQDSRVLVSMGSQQQNSIRFSLTHNMSPRDIRTIVQRIIASVV